MASSSTASDFGRSQRDPAAHDLDALPVPPYDAEAVPDDIEQLIVAAEARRQRFVAETQSAPIPAFIGSNPRVVYAALRHVAERDLALGRRFCEWGSGMGIVSCLASRLGFDAVGIEIEPRLVEAARRFAADHAPATRFVEGSYQPAGLFTETVERDRLDEQLGFSPTDFDLIYVYPWPAETSAAMRLFRTFGRDGGLLMSFHGAADLRLLRRGGNTADPREAALPIDQPIG